MINSYRQSVVILFVYSFIELLQFRKDKVELSLKNNIEIHPINIKAEEINIEDSPLYHAIKQTFTKEQLLIIFKEFVFLDIWGSIKQGFYTSVSLFKNVWWIIRNPKDAILKGASFIKDIPSIINNIWNELMNMSLKELLKCACQIGIFSLFLYLGFQVPDLDIAILGIGQHRHFFTHSIGPAILLNLIAKLGMRFINKIQANYHGESEWLTFLNTIIKTAQIGFTAGVAGHLGKDLFFDGSQTIRGPWDREIIPDFLRKNYRFDDGYLALNVLASSDLVLNSKRKVA